MAAIVVRKSRFGQVPARGASSYIRDFDDAVARVKAVAKVADNFIQGRPDLDDTIKRLAAFAEVGADVLYPQYPGNMDEVRAIVRAVAPKPVNLVVDTVAGTLPWADVQATGVKRLSLGAALYLRVMGNLAESAKDPRAGGLITASGEAPSSSTGLSFGELHQAMSKAIGA